MSQRSEDRTLWLAITVSAVLVIFRSFVFLRYEQNFDSDQAIVGLMAKHLSELRAFPLFFYGQNYMLGVQAWVAAPFFLLGGPTVTMLKLPLVLINVAVVALLIRLLTANGLRPALAFVATLPIAACGPLAAGQLLSALGASVEPLLYVVGLWMLRRRPIAFGILLCVGTLHREFTVFAVPAVALLEWLRLREIRWRAIASAAIAFGLTWIAIDQLKRHINIAGPGAEAGTSGSLALEAVHIGRLISFHPAVYLGRLRLVLTQGVPDLFGARPLELGPTGIWSGLAVGSSFAGAMLLAAALICIARLLWIVTRGRRLDVQFQLFLGLVAVQALLAYGLHGGADLEPRTELNYILLVLLLPVALLGAYLRLETSAGIRAAAMLLVAGWASAMAVDNARLVREYVMSPPESPHRELADYLTDHRIKYASGTYWDAYRVTFLSKERVIVASTDNVRIPGYQTRVELNRPNAARLVRMPCDEGTRVAEWCVVDPFQR